MNLRCHRHVKWQCESGLNMVTGENGSGKTTLLEAVYIMGHGRSFRQARDPQLRRWNCNEFLVCGKWQRYGPLRVDVVGKGRGMDIRLQGRQLQRRSELTGVLPVLVESPQGPRLVDGVPGERRRWLDKMMLYCRPDIARHYYAYLRCLMQRGRLVRKRGMGAEIEAWEHQLVVHGLHIMQLRTGILADINRELVAERALVEADVRMEICPTAPEEEKKWLAQLAVQRKPGRAREVLRIGPHCDRLLINYGNRDIRTCGSRGQQKLTAIALRLAECNLRMQHRGLAPMLLLDDCFEALDPIRQKQLLTRLAIYPGQILMTGPVGARFAKGSGIHYYILSAAQAEKRNKIQTLARPADTDMEEAA